MCNLNFEIWVVEVDLCKLFEIFVVVLDVGFDT